MECDSVHLLYRKCSRALVQGWEEGRARKEAEEEASAMEIDVDSRGAKKRRAEIDGDKRGEVKERTLHYCRSCSPLESVYLPSRREVCYWRTRSGNNEMDSSEVHSTNEPTCPKSSSF